LVINNYIQYNIISHFWAKDLGQNVVQLGNAIFIFFEEQLQTQPNKSLAFPMAKDQEDFHLHTNGH
jgi:hypothetical protein